MPKSPCTTTILCGDRATTEALKDQLSAAHSVLLGDNKYSWLQGNRASGGLFTYTFCFSINHCVASSDLAIIRLADN